MEGGNEGNAIVHVQLKILLKKYNCLLAWKLPFAIPNLEFLDLLQFMVKYCW